MFYFFQTEMRDQPVVVFALSSEIVSYQNVEAVQNARVTEENRIERTGKRSILSKMQKILLISDMLLSVNKYVIVLNQKL